MCHPVAARNKLLVIALACCCAALPSTSAAATYFSTDFNTTPLHVALGEDVNGSYVVKPGTSLSGNVVHCASCTAGLDRRYIRTNDSDYRTADFIYEITIDNSGDGTSFIGMGEGTGFPISSQPANAVFWRVASGQIWFSYRNGAEQTDVLVSAVAPETVYRAQITKRGNLIEFQLDEGNDGTFDYPPMVVDLNLSQFDFLDPSEHPENGRLFFGTAFTHREFDDMSVARFGDMNGDGALNSDDASPLVMALTNPVQYETMFGLSPDLQGDIDGSGTFDLGDLGRFVQLMNSASAAANVPEPNTVTLIVGALAVLARRRGGRATRPATT